MAWDVEVTGEFKAWWNGLTEAEMISVERAVLLLEERGPHLPFPYCGRVNGSRHSAMRELRVQRQGAPTGCSTFSTLAAWRFCCWVAATPAMTAG